MQNLTDTKRAALDAVREAAAAVAMTNPGAHGVVNREQAIAAARKLALAQMAAIEAGARPSEVTDASEWNGVPL